MIAHLYEEGTMAILLTINDSGKTTSIGDDAGRLLKAMRLSTNSTSFISEITRKLSNSMSGMVPKQLLGSPNHTITKERDTL